ncbi:dynamin family domain-containing protein [Trichoderma breve]|uniref:Dynamin family domain-containing protein n=1 Tax=Trichoderma breve TaxID=2034170 RepID=A0A9W9B485_9HYPO|nr:dynamin family domain-containing protein [Trichoderma breve]KAJ4855284.1 dynamin family domain-containing protein [Trichoderma breve]
MTASQDIITLSNPVLLEKIDKLRDANIGQHVPLPQLVVVGDQSSGKSSLLESLSGIPFPQDQSLCTRYATQITSRRDISNSVEFADILKKANERMGVRANVSTGNGTVFSEDVLKIEVCGPNEDYLTIIDVPGIFRTTMQGTTKDDMAMVRDLVKRYIKDGRTIILAVLPSNVDIATQEILELAEEYDKNGERTLGVLTKPDLGKKRPLNLGYFLVRNRGPNGDLEGPSELDKIFRKQPWADLPRDRVGIVALKEQLRSLLVEITRREFPTLIQDVSNQIRECKRELNSLGPPRQDEREQRSFLSSIAEAFQDRTRAALTADYNANSGFNEGELRLITHVVNITDVFSADFHESAHSRHFEKLEPAEPPEEVETPDDSDDKAGLMVNELRELLEKARVDDVAPEELAELADIISLEKISMPVPCDNFGEWINSVYLQSRGLDLGTFNANFLITAFAEQSRKWGDITKIYMRRIIIALHRFIAAALRSVCSEEQVRSKVWTAILESLKEGYKKAVDQAILLVEVEQRKQPYTLNKQFAQALSKARGYRVAETLRPKARKDTKQFGGTQFVINLDDIAKAVEVKSNVEQLQEEIHDILHAYYSLAADRFIDNVFQLAVDYCLLRCPSSPLKVFTQVWVIDLEAEQLEQIVGETRSAKRRRQGYVKKIADLTNALKILRT